MRIALIVAALLATACAAAKPVASIDNGPLAYTGEHRCTPGRERGLPDGEVCAFIYRARDECDAILMLPAGADRPRDSVVGMVCREGTIK